MWQPERQRSAEMSDGQRHPMISPKRILVIDDERRMADSICQLLAREGHSTAAAYGGRDGLARLEGEPFDLVLTDLKMPDIDGLEVLRQIRERHPETLVIVITAHATTESAIEAVRQAAFDYVPKPFEFGHLRASIERAFQRLETERLRADMMSMISHDIKVPLTSILGYATLMRDRRQGGWHPRAEEFLNIIASNANKILALLDNVLTTCKIDAGRLTLVRTPVRLCPVLEEIQSVLLPEAEKRRIALAIECPPDLPEIEGDESLLYRALANVIANALKYSPPNTRVDVRAGTVSAQDSPLGVAGVRVEVENPGPGIPAEELPRIFDRYQRSESGRGVEGTGLGLFVVKTVVEAHGGRVTVRSSPGETTLFTIHLPLGR